MDIFGDIIDKISSSEKLLIGIGERAKLVDDDYNNLLKIIEGKDYQIIDINENAQIRNIDFDQNKIVCPVCEDNNDQWESYLKWLQGTINKKLVILELGVGFKYPDVIRFPFEKTLFYNLKSDMYRVDDTFYQLTSDTSERGRSMKMNAHDFLQNLCKTL